MDMTAAVPLVEREWEEETGFFGRLQRGNFDTDAYARLLSTLESVEIEESATTLDRRFVELTWWIPQFISWQIERIEAEGDDAGELHLAANRIRNHLDRLLGVP